MPDITLLNEDCMIYMAGLPDKAFDLAIVDPPYGIGNWVNTTGNSKGKNNFDQVQWNGKESRPSLEWLAELKRVAVRRVIWGSNYYPWVDGGGGSLVWFKHVVRESNMSICEIASLSWLSRVDYVSIRWQNIGRSVSPIHPCQKPVSLYEWCLKNYAKPGQRILDTHLGSGSSAIAAHYFGCDFVGTELDPDYYAAAVNRFKNETAQEAMF